MCQVEKLLNAGGARKDVYMSEILTHCIADEDDDEVTEAKELFQLSVVKVTEIIIILLSVAKVTWIIII